jgi:TRAP-type mannitol/chloroaromatic compound transport system permease small subunit
MSNPASGLDSVIDRFSIATGHLVSWLTLAMVLVTFLIVILRYLFDVGFIWLQESVTWMHASVFMLGAAYTLQREEHVRVDIFYREMSERRRAFVNLFGVLLFLFPLCAFFVVSGFDYAAASWRVAEESRNSGGLPYPAVPLLKSVLIIMPLALALQGTALIMRCLRSLRAT